MYVLYYYTRAYNEWAEYSIIILPPIVKSLPASIHPKPRKLNLPDVTNEFIHTALLS